MGKGRNKRRDSYVSYTNKKQSLTLIAAPLIILVLAFLFSPLPQGLFSYSPDLSLTTALEGQLFGWTDVRTSSVFELEGTRTVTSLSITLNGKQLPASSDTYSIDSSNGKTDISYILDLVSLGQDGQNVVSLTIQTTEGEAATESAPPTPESE